MTEPKKWWRGELFSNFNPFFQIQIPAVSGEYYECDGRWLFVPKKLVPHILGALATLETPDVLAGSDADINTTMDMIREFEYLLMTGIPAIQLRQKPGDCVLQQSFDCGVTWQDVFDFGSCVSEATLNITKYVNEQEIVTITNTYQGDITNIAPDMEYDQTVDDLVRNAALCVALRVFIKTIVESERQRREQNYQNWERAANIAQDIGLALTRVGSGWALVGAEIGAAILRLAAKVMRDIDEVLLTNEDAMVAVACCMYRALRDQTPSEALWKAALDNCNFTFGTPEYLMAIAIKPALNTERLEGLRLFLAFHKQLQELYPLAEQGIFDACPCEDVCSVADFTIDEQLWNFTTVVYNSPGHYTSGIGFVADDTSLHPIGGGRYVALHVYNAFPDMAVERVRIVYDLHFGETDFNHRAYRITTIRDGVLIAQKEVLRSQAVQGDSLVAFLDVNEQIDQILVELVCAHNPVQPANPPGSAILKRVEVLCP